MERTGLEPWKPREVARLLALLESERRYHQEILALVPAALVVLADDRSIVSANRAFRRILNLKNEDFLQKTIEEIIPSHELVERIRSAHVHGDTKPVTLVLDTGDLDAGNLGQRRLRVAIIPMPARNDGVEAETLLMVEELSGFEAPPVSQPYPRTTSAIDPSLMPAVLWQADPATFSCTAASGASEELLGYPASHWTAAPQFIFGRIHPDDRAGVTALYRSTAATGGEASAEFRAVSASGKSVWCRETIRVSGRIITGVMTSIGQRRQLETQSLVAARVDALRSLSARLAHDLNNPLMIVTGYAEEMLRALAAEDPLRNDVAEILAAANRVTEVAGRLLEFTRSQAQPPSRIPLNRLVVGLRQRLEAAFPGIPIELKADDQIEALADREQLEEASLAFASAAVENTREVSRLSVRCRTRQVTEQIAPAFQPDPLQPAALHAATLGAGVYASIEIQATGAGLGTSAAGLGVSAAGMFESFLPSKDPAQKTGDAVSRAYANVRQWGGDVVFSSDAARGSGFLVYLPLAESEAGDLFQRSRASSPAESSEEIGVPTRETILIVEDETGIRGLLRRILRRERYQVLEARSGEEALSMAAAFSQPIHLLLTDMMLPGMSGRELAGTLRQRRPELKVLYISGFTEDESARRGEFPPGAKFLQKPFTLSALTGKVEDALNP